MTDPAPPRLILVAGVPRSGSTWAFNAARRLLGQAPGGLHAAWVADRDPHHPARTHLVKAHQPGEVDFAPDLVLTTRRAAEECLASLIRMGWLADDPAAIRRAWVHHNRLYTSWKARSDHEISYAGMIADPARELTRLAAALEVDLSAQDAGRIAAELAAMEAPETGTYDPETLLHPGHRAAPGAAGRRAEEILRLLQG
ncbi:hypothetical protein ACFO5X_21160 [Seohaeicola nanhaiensis]|uniref:Sulfotransferase family protein n=1 Tax=Seohaeicola nanhaiensis TaxID=1387282 RepID=A0ABV9KLP2_9RHOB